MLTLRRALCSFVFLLGGTVVLPPATAVAKAHKAKAGARAKDGPAFPAPPPGAGGTALVTWREIIDLPAVAGQSTPGLAGIFAGALDATHAVVAGGTFYEGKGPLEGGQRRYTDALMVVEERPGSQGGQPIYGWVSQPTRLPRPLAYGVSWTLEDGILCAGGSDGVSCSAEVFLLTWNPIGLQVEKVDFPPLPKPLAFAGAGRVGSWVIVAGGTTTPEGRSGADVFGLDLDARGDPAAFQWQVLPPMPAALHFPICVGQSQATGGAFHVFGGRDLRPGRQDAVATDGWTLDLATRTWSSTGPIKPTGAADPVALMGGTAVGLEPDRVLLLGGDDGAIARFLEDNSRRGGSAEEQAAWAQVNAAVLAAHPGYRRDLLLYDTRLKTWRVAGQFPTATPAVTPAFMWDGAIVLAGGEPSPGRRSAKVWLGVLESP